MSKFEKFFVTLVLTADLLAVVFFGGLFVIHGSLIPHKYHDDPTKGLIVASAEKETTAAEIVVEEFDWDAFEPDLARGQQVAAKCKACHSFDKGGPNKIGPAMWGTFGAEIMHAADFNYSAAFQGLAGELVWNRESLDAYLENPKRYIPGTKMAFPGIRKQEDRANLIAWLETLR